MQAKIESIKQYVQQELKGAEAGHDWFHIERVYRTSMKIAQSEEKADVTIVALIALLHDIADSKFHQGDESIGPLKAKQILQEVGFSSSIIEHVVLGIENISFKGGNHAQSFRSLELDIVQDADRLDAIGAIGIARAFNYGGFKNNVIYDPAIDPKLGMSKEEYKKYQGTTINHFYEKLLLLSARFNTAKGKELAKGRHDFMELFLAQFYAEVDAEM